MDYRRVSRWLRLRKLWRYLRMYGPSRTACKVRGQYHLRARYDPLPARRRLPEAAGHVGIIGCGNYAFTTIAYYLRKERGRVLRGVMDIDPHRAASLFERYGAAYHTTDATEVLSDPKIDIVYIASNHASHADYAVAAIEAGKAVHIEKPHVVDRAQLERLMAAAASAEQPRIRLGFNRRWSRLGHRVVSTIAEEPGSCVGNWSVIGHRLEPGHWYLRPGEGGRVLGNLCHWTDFSLLMVPEARRYPIRLIPGRSAASDCDMALTMVFGDDSLVAITFAECETFEGVRENLHVSKGETLISLADFEQVVIERGPRKTRVRTLFRDHGHRETVLASYRMSRAGGRAEGESLGYLRETAELFLSVREAMDADQQIVVERA